MDARMNECQGLTTRGSPQCPWAPRSTLSQQQERNPGRRTKGSVTGSPEIWALMGELL